MVGLIKKIIKYVIQQQKGKNFSHISAEIGTGSQYVRKLWIKFQNTGMIQVFLQGKTSKDNDSLRCDHNLLDHYIKIL